MQNSLSKIQNTSAQKPTGSFNQARTTGKASIKSSGISATRGVKSSIQDASVEEEEVNAYFKAAATEGKPKGKTGSMPPAPGRKAGAGSNS